MSRQKRRGASALLAIPFPETAKGRLRNRISIILDLTKVRISLFAAFAASTGYVVGADRIGVEMLGPVLGIFLLACGAACINQYQERISDGLMERTKGRPIPSGEIIPRTALASGILLIGSGTVFLLFGGSVFVPALSFFALFWYNGVYIWLKRRSAFAAIPGALVGAVPPAVGWISGRGFLETDPAMIALCLFFFIWQVPHFWILMLIYHGEYESAGLPSVAKVFPDRQFRVILFVWISAAGAFSLLLPMFGLVRSWPFLAGLLASAFWLGWRGTFLLRTVKKGFSVRALFKAINVHCLLVMLILLMDCLAAN